MWTPTHVQVTVHRARNLKTKGKGDTNDAYVTITLGKEKYQTSIKERSKDPEWHEECDLPIPGEGAMITLKAFHRNLLGLDEFLGYTEIPLEEFKIYERPRSRWYALKNRPNSKKPEKYRGEIEIKVTFIVQSLSTSQLSLSKLDKLKRASSIKSVVNQVGGKLNKLGGKGSLFRTGSKTELDDNKSDAGTLVSTPQVSTPDGSPTIHTFSKRDLNKSHDILPTSFNNHLEDDDIDTVDSDIASASFDSEVDHSEKDTEPDFKPFRHPHTSIRASRGKKSRLAKMHLLSQSTLAIPGQESAAMGRAKTCRVVEPEQGEQLAQSMLDLSNTTSPSPCKKGTASEGMKDDQCSDTSFPVSIIPDSLVEEEETTEDQTPYQRAEHVINSKDIEFKRPDIDPVNSHVNKENSDALENQEKPSANGSLNPFEHVEEEKVIPVQPEYEAPLLKKTSITPRRKMSEGEENAELSPDDESAQPLTSLPEESAPDDVGHVASDPEKHKDSNGWNGVDKLEDTQTHLRRNSSGSAEADKENDDNSHGKPAKKRDRGKKVKEPSRRHTLQDGLNPKSAATHELHEGISEYKSEQERKSSESRESSLPPALVEQFKDNSRDDLIKIILEQRNQLKKKDATMKDLENYIDNLLVRVMESTPKILQTEEEKRQGSPMRSLNYQAYTRTFSSNHPSEASVSFRMINSNNPQVSMSIQKNNLNNSNSKNNRSPAKEKKPFSLFKKGR